MNNHIVVTSDCTQFFVPWQYSNAAAQQITRFSWRDSKTSSKQRFKACFAQHSMMSLYK